MDAETTLTPGLVSPLAQIRPSDLHRGVLLPAAAQHGALRGVLATRAPGLSGPVHGLRLVLLPAAAVGGAGCLDPRLGVPPVPLRVRRLQVVVHCVVGALDVAVFVQVV